MGHETNSTRAFRDQITNKDPYDDKKVRTDPRTGEPVPDLLVEYRQANPHFQIRVHAGENPVHPENVREAILAGATRIGHGLYGTDESTLSMASKRGVIGEFNFGSNKALNNVESTRPTEELPIKNYHESKVRVTFGTDGSMYLGGGKAETHVGMLAGLTHEDLIEIARSDLRYKQEMEAAFHKNWNKMVDRCIDRAVEKAIAASSLDEEQAAALRDELTKISEVARGGPTYYKNLEAGEKLLWDEFQSRVLRAGDYGLPDKSTFPGSTFDWGKYNAERKAVQTKLNDSLAEKGIRVWDQGDLKEMLAGRTPILISGASQSSWPKISDKDAVRDLLRKMVDDADPAKVVFVTGATHFGVEEELHQIVKQKNDLLKQEGKPTYQILGTVVDETIPAEVGPITDAVSLGDRWYAKSGPLMRFVNENKGAVVFIGGGNILNDEIQAAWNLGSKFYLMKGPEGASTTKAESYQSHAFTTYDDLQSFFASDGIQLRETGNVT
jgi:hypothetical protein